MRISKREPLQFSAQAEDSCYSIRSFLCKYLLDFWFRFHALQVRRNFCPVQRNHAHWFVHFSFLMSVPFFFCSLAFVSFYFQFLFSCKFFYFCWSATVPSGCNVVSLPYRQIYSLRENGGCERITLLRRLTSFLSRAQFRKAFIANQVRCQHFFFLFDSSKISAPHFRCMCDFF